MIDPVNNYLAYAGRLLDEIQGADDPARVYERFCACEPRIREIPPPQFRLEFHALLLAFTTLQWEVSCGENRIADERIQRAFLRTVTQSFQSPQSLLFAQTFSGYLHAPEEAESDSPALLLLASRFFRRLGLNEHLKKDLAAAKINPAFSDLVHYLEGFKSSFAARFDEFVTSNLA